MRNPAVSHPNRNEKLYDIWVFLGLFVLACLLMAIFAGCCPPRDYTKLQRSIQPILVEYEEWMEEKNFSDDQKAAREFNLRELKKTIGLEQPPVAATENGD